MKHRAAHSGERLMQVVKSLVGLIWEMLMGKVKAGEIWLCYVSFSNCRFFVKFRAFLCAKSINFSKQ
nr:MAG TPA: mRNA interferase MazF [Caudoviricetes sp.]